MRSKMYYYDELPPRVRKAIAESLGGVDDVYVALLHSMMRKGWTEEEMLHQVATENLAFRKWHQKFLAGIK